MENETNTDYYPWASQEEKDFEFSIMDEYYSDLDKEEKKNKAITDEILNYIKPQKLEAWFKDLMDYAEEAETHNPFKIVSKPQGQWQEEDGYPLLGGVWVDQHASACCEDCYYGTVTVKISDNRYLEMPFNC